MSLIDEIKKQEENQITKEWVSEHIDLIIETAAQNIYSDLRKQILEDVRTKGEDGKKGIWCLNQMPSGFYSHIYFHRGTYVPDAVECYVFKDWWRSDSVLERKDNNVNKFYISYAVDTKGRPVNYKSLVKEPLNSSNSSFSLTDFQDVVMFEDLEKRAPYQYVFGVTVEFKLIDCFEEKKGVFGTKKTWRGFTFNQHLKKLVKRISEIAKDDGVQIEGPKIIQSFTTKKQGNVKGAYSENECFYWDHTHYEYDSDYTIYNYIPGFKYSVMDD